MNRTKIKAVEIVLFVCLLVSCFVVPRFVTSRLLSGIVSYHSLTPGERSTEALLAKYNVRPARTRDSDPVFPEGGWFEQVLRLGLIGLTVFYAFRVAKRVDRGPEGEDPTKT
jgi:hypothetical protein